MDSRSLVQLLTCSFSILSASQYWEGIKVTKASIPFRMETYVSHQNHLSAVEKVMEELKKSVATQSVDDVEKAVATLLPTLPIPAQMDAIVNYLQAKPTYPPTDNPSGVLRETLIASIARILLASIASEADMSAMKKFNEPLTEYDAIVKRLNEEADVKDIPDEELDSMIEIESHDIIQDMDENVARVLSSLVYRGRFPEPMKDFGKAKRYSRHTAHIPTKYNTAPLYEELAAVVERTKKGEKIPDGEKEAAQKKITEMVKEAIKYWDVVLRNGLARAVDDAGVGQEIETLNKAIHQAACDTVDDRISFFGYLHPALFNCIIVVAHYLSDPPTHIQQLRQRIEEAVGKFLLSLSPTMTIDTLPQLVNLLSLGRDNTKVTQFFAPFHLPREVMDELLKRRKMDQALFLLGYHVVCD
jgi:hypothetical protein